MGIKNSRVSDEDLVHRLTVLSSTTKTRTQTIHSNDPFRKSQFLQDVEVHPYSKINSPARITDIEKIYQFKKVISPNRQIISHELRRIPTPKDDESFDGCFNGECSINIQRPYFRTNNQQLGSKTFNTAISYEDSKEIIKSILKIRSQRVKRSLKKAKSPRRQREILLKKRVSFDVSPPQNRNKNISLFEFECLIMTIEIKLKHVKVQ